MKQLTTGTTLISAVTLPGERRWRRGLWRVSQILPAEELIESSKILAINNLDKLPYTSICQRKQTPPQNNPY